MAGAAFYSSRVNRQVVLRNAPREALGIGEAVSALGRTAGAIAQDNRQTQERVSEVDFAIAEREKARARDAVSADVAVRLAQGEGEYARWVTDNSNDAQFESKANAKVEADMAGLLGMLGDDTDLLDRYEPILTRVAESRRTGAYSHVAAIRAKVSRASFEQFETASLDAIQTDPARAGQFADLAETRIAEDSSIPDALKPVLVADVRGKFLAAGLETAIDLGEGAAVGQALSAGEYDGKLPEGAKDALLKRVDIAARETAAAAERAGKEAQDAARDEIKSLKTIIDNGDDPGNARIAAAGAAAKAAGLDEAELLEAGYLVEGAARAQAAAKMPTPALRQRVRGLEAREATGALSNAERRELTDYGAQLDARDKRAGAKVEALDEGEAVVALRGLKRSERVAVAAQGAVAARRVVLADLDDASNATIAVGAQKRKDLPNAYMPRAAGKTEGDADLAKQAFRETLGQRVVNSLGAGYEPLLTAALDLYVGSQVKAGDNGGWNLREFKKSVRVAFGGTRRRANADGVAVYQGGLDDVRGRMVVLPDKLTAEEFDRGLSRLDFGKRGAMYGDGSAARTRDVMANFAIVLDHQDDDGMVWYRFEDARGTPLGRKGGGAFLEGFAG